MTHQLDVARGRSIAARGCALAEQRLEYLTELFETGRWRRFHSEAAFLENIREAKAALEIWRGLSAHAASGENAANMSWLARTRATLPGGETWRDRLQPAQIPAERPLAVISIKAETDRIFSDEAPCVPEIPTPAMDTVSELTLGISAIQERYPLLRHAL